MKVNQLGNTATGSVARIRTFNYDSLSRLLCASNPENSTAVCPAANTGAYVVGTTGYTYDANGNVMARTDARGSTTNYKYDALNRLVSKTYPSDSKGTTISCFQYDLSSIPGAGSNLKGRLTNAWTQAANTTCSGSSSTYAPTAGSYLSLKSLLNYDAMGRPTLAQQQQCIGSKCSAPAPYSLSMAYDLIGNIMTLTNSAGAPGQSLTLNNYFDTAARPCLTTSSWGGNFPQTLFQVNPSTSGSTVGYTAFGSLANWYMGLTSATASSSCSSQPSSPMNVTQGYTSRMWLNNITASGMTP